MPRRATGAKPHLFWEVNGQKMPITKDTVWYHGSPTAKLKPGDVLLPPSKTGNLNWDMGEEPDGRGVVFITPDINQAVYYAGGPHFGLQLAHECYG